MVICSSGKPKFFSERKPFKRLDKDLEATSNANGDLNSTDVFAEGNSTDLMKFMSDRLGREPKVLYFGDSLRSDMAPVKKHINWDVVMVLEEMIGEKHQSVSNGEGPANKIARRVDHRESWYKGHLTSKKWGSYFVSVCEADKDGLGDDLGRIAGQGSMVKDTIWGELLKQYPDLIIPHMDYLIGSFSTEMKEGKVSVETACFYSTKPSVLQ